MRNDVERDLLGEFFRVRAVTDEDVAALLEQFIHALFASARDGLVGRDNDARDLGIIVQRLQRDDELGRRAVRVRNDILALIDVDRVWVDLRHDQRDIWVHTEQRAVIDDHTACSSRNRRIFLGCF